MVFSLSVDNQSLTASPISEAAPSVPVDTRAVFGIEAPMAVYAFAERSAHVPDVDRTYRFDPATTIAILAGFASNRRVLVQGYHGTGKSTHIEQIAARLNWPCIRINLDGHISRIDLIGRDAIVVRDGLQVTEFQEGLLPWALQRPCALVFDEYDAGRPETMFVIQRVLEEDSRLTLLDQNRIIRAHPSFRLFATANTAGWGDTTGLYHGTQALNQAQMDRWNIIANLDYLPHDQELKIALATCPEYDTPAGLDTLNALVALAQLTRAGFASGDISAVMSPRTVITCAQNATILGSITLAFQLSFLNRCEELERPIVAEYFQRCLGEDLPSPGAHA